MGSECGDDVYADWRLASLEEEGNEEIEEYGVEGDGDDEADDDSDDAEPFDVLVAVDAGGEVVGDLFVENRD